MVAVPLPETAERPADEMVSVPLVTHSVVVSIPAPASASLTKSSAIAVSVFASISRAAGTVFNHLSHHRGGERCPDRGVGADPAVICR